MDSCSLQDPTLRPRVWKILLGVNNISADKYLRYVGRGPCEFKEKIRNDTFRSVSSSLFFSSSYNTNYRTLATDRGFKERGAKPAPSSVKYGGKDCHDFELSNRQEEVGSVQGGGLCDTEAYFAEGGPGFEDRHRGVR